MGCGYRRREGEGRACGVRSYPTQPNVNRGFMYNRTPTIDSRPWAVYSGIPKTARTCPAQPARLLHVSPRAGPLHGLARRARAHPRPGGLSGLSACMLRPIRALCVVDARPFEPHTDGSQDLGRPTPASDTRAVVTTAHVRPPSGRFTISTHDLAV